MLFGRCKSAVRERRCGLGEGLGALSTPSIPSWEEEEHEGELEGSYRNQDVGVWLDVRHR